MVDGITVPLVSGTTTVWNNVATLNPLSIDSRGELHMTYSNCMYETYAWNGFNFLLIAIGVCILAGSVCFLYECYKAVERKTKELDLKLKEVELEQMKFAKPRSRH